MPRCCRVARCCKISTSRPYGTHYEAENASWCGGSSEPPRSLMLQDPHLYFVVALPCCNTQWCVAIIILVVKTEASCHQLLHLPHTATRGSCVQWCVVTLVSLVQVPASSLQLLNHLTVTTDGGGVDWGAASVVSDGLWSVVCGLQGGRDEQGHTCLVAPVCSKVESSGSCNTLSISLCPTHPYTDDSTLHSSKSFI